MSIKITDGYNVVVREISLKQRGLDVNDLILGEDFTLTAQNGIILFGPLFGIEAQEELIHRLKKIGLNYYDDFIEINIELPEWVCAFARSNAT